MHTARRLSAFVRTNALLANLCDTKKSLRQRGPYAHRRRLQVKRRSIYNPSDEIANEKSGHHGQTFICRCIIKFVPTWHEFSMQSSVHGFIKLPRA